ncbi:ABC transporter substrate-binding protein [Clostridium celatum]|uniref:ABC transporter substrate-binding protein n=1 Tax=Clostridium celatum TaxID=36834 RepID=UPI002915088F|nr:ABC transporter substrate-binding protein [Clostridium celatum]MDU6297220.1 ABC transporter substrate-binding protein [Clostridium celatum]
MSKVFKKFLAIVGVVAFIGVAFMGCGKTDKNTNTSNEEKKAELQTVRLNEVVRSVFYAPMYVAINEGFFEEEGLEIDLSTGQGADAKHSKQQHVCTNKKRGCRSNYSLIL